MAAPIPPSPSPSPRPPSLWGRRAVVVLLGLAAFAWSLPMLIANTPLLGAITGQASSMINGRVVIGSASLGWFSPIVLRNVQVNDLEGSPVLVVERIETDRSIVGLVTSSKDLGTIKLIKPVVDVILVGKQSNLEKLLEPILKLPPSESQEPTTPPKIGVEITEGTIRVFDSETKQKLEFEQFSLQARLFQDPKSPVNALLRSSLTDGSVQGSIEAHLNMADESQGELKGRLHSFPLHLLGVIASRVQPGTELSGYLHGTCSGSWTMANGQLQAAKFEGELNGQNLLAAHASLEDRVQLDSLKMPCKLELVGNTLKIHQAEVTCDFAQASVVTAFDLTADPKKLLEVPGQTLDLTVDLARLVNKLPKTLNVHPDLKVREGKLKLACRSVAKEAGVSWEGDLVTTELLGLKGNQPVEWREPISIAFKLRPQGNDLPMIDHLRCESSFLKVQGNSTPKQLFVKADLELDRLAEPLSRFIDLGNIRLGGTASSIATVQQLEGQRFDIQIQSQLRQFVAEFAKKIYVQEPSLEVQSQTVVHAGGKTRVETGKLTAMLGGEKVVAQLEQPISDLIAGPWGQWNVRADGDLSRLLPKLKPFTTSLDGFQIVGQVNVQTKLTPSLTSFELANVQVDGAGVRLVGAGLFLNEKAIAVKSAGRIDLARMNVELKGTQVTTQAVQVQSPRLALDLNKGFLDGEVNLTGDVAKLQQWTQDPKLKAGEPIHGALRGSARIKSAGNSMDFSFHGSVSKLTMGNPAKPSWQEPEVKITMQGQVDSAQDMVELAALHVESQLATADAKGRISKLSGSKDVQVTGAITYDLAKMEPFLRPSIGADLKLVGKDSRSFSLTGPLYASATQGSGVKMTLQPPTNAPMTLKELKGNAGLSWTKVEALGCDIGPADLKAVMQMGWIQVYPIETTLNEGKLKLQPNVRLEPGPMDLIVPKGQLLERARITPKMCASAMGFALPLLAKAAEADGAVSVNLLDTAKFPATNPMMGEAKGTITLHHAKVSPGPMVKELATLFKAPPQHFLIKECNVPVQMVQGKVYHQGLEVNFGDVWVKTSGWVGVDGTMSLIAEMPIPGRWLPGGKISENLAKQTIKVPIGGTVSQPKLDQVAVRTISEQVLKSVGGDFLRQGVEKNLGNLLKKLGN